MAAAGTIDPSQSVRGTSDPVAGLYSGAMARTLAALVLTAIACDRAVATGGPARDAPRATLVDGPAPDAALAVADAAPPDDGGGGRLFRDAPAPADGGAPLPYTLPTAFDGFSRCERAGFGEVSLPGVWALDLSLPGRQGPGVFSFEKNGDLLQGRDGPLVFNHIEQSDGRLFFYYAIDRMGVPSVRSFLACQPPAPGGQRFSGLYGSCGNGSCVQGTFEATRVERRAGELEADGLSKLGEIGFPNTVGITTNVRVLGRHAFLSRYQDGLRIVDVSDPARPVAVGHGETETPANGEIYNDVKLLPGWAFLASTAHGVVVWDVSNSAAPIRVANLEDGTNVHTLFLVGTTLYAASTGGGFSGLVMWDVSNPRMPARLGQLDQPVGTDYLHDLYVEPGRAYLDYWEAGLLVVDVTDPARARELGRFDAYARRKSHSSWVTTIGGRKIAVHGDEDFGAHTRILDVTDPASITLLSEYQTRPEVSVHNVYAEGSRAFLSHYQDGLRVLDLADPRAPRPIAYFNSWSPAAAEATSFYEGAIGLDKVGDLVYLADTTRDLLILRLER